jgi:alkanesulfonate monooxygenase SsuD/methylene tetrahydromethanopterin reductase-like flavin-dependent oxidoreductase (luciferase family)
VADYGHDLMFGAMLEPPPERAVDVVALAILAEQAGLDAVSLADHPYWPERLDTFALLAVIAARTDRVRVFSNLANLPLRPPVMLSRTAATLDVLSDGRFELGIGSGAQQMWDAIVAEGGPRRDAAKSIDALGEAVQVIRALWTTGPELSFNGRHYRIAGAKPGPAPAHDMNIWLGAYQPRMLRLVGRVADGWIPSSPYLPPEQLPAANQIIDVAAVDAGRSPDAVRRIYNIGGEFSRTGRGFLHGPPALWVEQLTELSITEGISGYILYRVESGDVIRTFADEVAPAVRSAVSTERERQGRVRSDRCQK